MRNAVAMQIMAADLDGDGAVTVDEMRRKYRYDRRIYAGQNHMPVASVDQQIEQQIERVMQADADKDGRITWVEAIEYAKKQPNYIRSLESGLVPVMRQLLMLVPDGKSAVTLADIDAAATDFFRSVDTDHNGTISIDELNGVRQALNRVLADTARQQAMEKVRVNCEMPKASEAAKVMLLGAYETEALSSVALGSQDDVTGVGNITVEPGNEPLYLVIATYRPTIWRFYGAVERIERVVMLSQRGLNRPGSQGPLPLAGVVGLPADKASFPKAVNCLSYFYETPSVASAQASGAVKTMVGKVPDLIAGIYKFSTFNVPSGKIEMVEKDRPRLLVIQKPAGTLTIEGDPKDIRVVTPSGDLQRELYRFNPGGVVTIDAKKVVASVNAEPYEVLPEQAGLIQLVQSGALTQNGLGEFLINKKIRYPAGLAGAHSVKFLLRRGVPDPDGDPGHSTVVSEETGAPVQRRPAR
jgi:Ca2+-binding EF-hand superfamily protein